MFSRPGSSAFRGVLPWSAQELSDRYTLSQRLGLGQHCRVFQAWDLATGEEVAVKTFRKPDLQEGHWEHIRSEVECLQRLVGHPNVVRFLQTFENPRYVHLVLETLRDSQDLISFVASAGSDGGRLLEDQARAVARALLKAVAFCHSQHVVHRNVCPENILVLPGPQGGAAGQLQRVKLIGFGVASVLEDGKPLKENVGSAGYAAPEMLKRKYGKECDVWSCGVVLYILLSGSQPFTGRSLHQINNAVLKGEVDLTGPGWGHTSGDAKNLIQSMLTANPALRITAEEALKHPWLSEGQSHVHHGPAGVHGEPKQHQGNADLSSPSDQGLSFHEEDFVAQEWESNAGSLDQSSGASCQGEGGDAGAEVGAALLPTAVLAVPGADLGLPVANRVPRVSPWMVTWMTPAPGPWKPPGDVPSL